MRPDTTEAYDLLHQGALALAEVECNGMAVDEAYLDQAILDTKRRVAEIAHKIQSTEVAKVWRRKYGDKMSLGSPKQLSDVLFGEMGYAPPKKTESDQDSTDDEALNQIDDPFIEPYLRWKKFVKAGGTFLANIRRECVDGIIRCFFHLHTTVTYRSSSDDFNFQNLPVRDEEISKLIRKCFIARPGRRIVEVDYSGAEVRVAACYHKDSRMISYILDPTTDMHRDMAMEIYMLPQAEVSKPIRHCAKNQFVFPQFYGDWFKSCGQQLWRSVEKMKLLTAGGKSLRDHLKSKGLLQLGDTDARADVVPGTFLHHLRKVEQSFWGERFREYSQWKDEWYEAYQAKGWFQTLTGFVCRGYMNKKDVINYPVQGSAFHLLLRSLIRLVKFELPRRKMKSLVVGQIHDSIVFDAVEEEVPELLALCKHVMTKWIVKYAPWLIVPMDIEAEAAPVGGSWADKKPIQIAA